MSLQEKLEALQNRSAVLDAKFRNGKSWALEVQSDGLIVKHRNVPSFRPDLVTIESALRSVHGLQMDAEE